MAVNHVNRLHLDKDALVVGDNQLATTGGGVYVKRNLVIGGNVYVDGTVIAGGSSISGGSGGTVLGGGGAITGVVTVQQGGTNATTASAALDNLGGITASKATALSLIFR
jgi:hypothetical protein